MGSSLVALCLYLSRFSFFGRRWSGLRFLRRRISCPEVTAASRALPKLLWRPRLVWPRVS